MPPPSATTDSYVENIDLTTSAPTSSAPTTSFFPQSQPFPTNMKPLPGHYSTARRRIYARRDRIYSRTNPDVIAERLDLEEDAPLLNRHRALSHLSVAYAAAGYAHSTLCVVVSLALAAGVTAFARSLYADVTRKTSLRADDLSLKAAECLTSRTNNGCAINDGIATHVVPALDTLCKKWYACEQRANLVNEDALSASVWAETFAETVNSFTDKISSTAVVIALSAGIVVAFLMSSAAFGLMHKRVVETRVPDDSIARQMLTASHDGPFAGAIAAGATHTNSYRGLLKNSADTR